MSAAEERLEQRQLRCVHVWRHESIIQPGGRGYSTSWCRKCKISAHEYEKARLLALSASAEQDTLPPGVPGRYGTYTDEDSMSFPHGKDDK